MATPAPIAVPPRVHTPATPPDSPSRVPPQAIKMSGDIMQEQIKNEAIQGGAPAFKFDPSASPEEKAAEAKKEIPEGLKLQPSTKAAPLINPDVSTPVTKAPSRDSQTPEPSDKSTYVNGHPKAGDGEWGRTGWAPRFGAVVPELSGLGVPLEAMDIDKTTWLEKTLEDKFFGDWYHNAGIIVGACLMSWMVALFGGGIAWVIIVCAICMTYYRTSIKRLRRNIRDDLTREAALNRVSTDSESLEWINNFVLKFWPIYQPVLAATVINSVDQVLSTATPAFLDSLRLETFTMGTKPPRLEHVRTYPKTEDDIVEMDWKFSFNPNDTSDMTSVQLKSKINPKIVLEIRVGKGIASKGLPVIVEDFACSGEMKVKIKLQINFPHIEKVDVCFLQPPRLDFVCKPLGGDLLGLDIGLMPGLKTFILDMVHSNLRPMFYAPHVFTLNIAQMLAGAAVDTAIGVLAVTIHNAQGLKNPDKFSGTPDPYVNLCFNGRDVLAKTNTKKENANPRWNETVYLIITSFNDSLWLQVFDYNEFRKDKELGVASFPLKSLEEGAPEQENVQLPVIANGKPRGLMNCDFRFFPVLEGAKNADGTTELVPETNTGILRYTIHRAKELDYTKSMIGQLSPYANFVINGKKIKTTKIIKRSNDPIWEEHVEILVKDRAHCKLGLLIKDSRDLAEDPTIGYYQISLNGMLDATAKGQDWFNLSGVKTGKVQIRAQWKPVALKGDIGGDGGYIKPIGVLRIHLVRAKDLRNVEKLRKSDPYVRILLSGIEKGRTVTFDDNLNPDWDEILYVPIHSNREKVTLEVMDAENIGKDRPLGQYDFDVAPYITESDEVEGEFLPHTERKEQAVPLILDRSRQQKGTLFFNVSFYPTINVAEPEPEKIEETPVPESDPDLEVKATTPISATAGADVELLEEAENAGEEEAPKRKKSVAVKLSPEELLSNNSGLLVFKLHDVELSQRDCYLQVLMDDFLFPSFMTSKIRSRVGKVDEIGDAFVRELEFSKVRLRLVEHHKDTGDKPDVIAELKGDTYNILKQALHKPTVLTMRNKNGDGVNKVNVTLSYTPVQMRLDERESITNMGSLRVDVLDGQDLPAADSNGKSDPYVVFELNGEKVFKTEIQKKTLHPAWNEFFTVEIPSKATADFKCRVMDWDLAGEDDFLGAAVLDLTKVEPFKKSIAIVPLDGKSGSIRLAFVFTPAYVMRQRHSTATFSGTFAVPGKIVTNVAGAPIKGITKVGGGVIKGASFIGKNVLQVGRKKDKEEVVEEPAPQASVTQNHNLSVADVSVVDDARSSGSASPPRLKTPNRDSTSTLNPFGSHRSQKSISGASILPETGTAQIILVRAQGYKDGQKLYVHVSPQGKDKQILKSSVEKFSNGSVAWHNDERAEIQCTPDMSFKVQLWDDTHKFRKDDLVGEGLLILSEGANPAETTIQVGPGTVTFKTSFKTSESERPGSRHGNRKSLFGRSRNNSPP
ncbi:Tricalbin-3 [Arthrobotrys entomopaga]|nr:Tricalbin-3 [Arthrobotrys entomopaga]